MLKLGIDKQVAALKMLHQEEEIAEKLFNKKIQTTSDGTFIIHSYKLKNGQMKSQRDRLKMKKFRNIPAYYSCDDYVEEAKQAFLKELLASLARRIKGLMMLCAVSELFIKS